MPLPKDRLQVGLEEALLLGIISEIQEMRKALTQIPDNMNEVLVQLSNSNYNLAKQLANLDNALRISGQISPRDTRENLSKIVTKLNNILEQECNNDVELKKNLKTDLNKDLSRLEKSVDQELKGLENPNPRKLGKK